MAQKTFKSIRALKEHAREQAKIILRTTVLLAARKALREAIREAYNEYTSSADNPYKRREYRRGGLLDRNYMMDYISSDGLSVRVRQESPSPVGGKYLVDVYVTRGDLYNWESSEIYGLQPFPRDFYFYAKFKLEERLPELVKDAFEQRGIKAERINVNVRFK